MTLTLNLAPILPSGALDRMLGNARSVMAAPPDEIIDHDYLIRWHAIRSAALCKYHHLYIGNDPKPWSHDHPWPSLSLCLQGALLETQRLPNGEARTASISRGVLAYRPARAAHRLDLVQGPAVTIFFTGPRIRQWGFYLPGGWCPAHEFFTTNPDHLTPTGTKP